MKINYVVVHRNTFDNCFRNIALNASWMYKLNFNSEASSAEAPRTYRILLLVCSCTVRYYRQMLILHELRRASSEITSLLVFRTKKLVQTRGFTLEKCVDICRSTFIALAGASVVMQKSSGAIIIRIDHQPLSVALKKERHPLPVLDNLLPKLSRR